MLLFDIFQTFCQLSDPVPLLQNEDFLVPKNTVQATNENDAPQNPMAQNLQ